MHIELEERAPLDHATEVTQPRLQQVGVTEDDLLAGEAAHARALDADVLDGPQAVIDREEVADPKGLVERDRERCQEVGEHGLHGERERDAADT